MIGGRLLRAAIRDHRIAERARAAAHVAQHEVLAGAVDLHARRVAAERVGHRELELLLDELARFLISVEPLAGGRDERPHELRLQRLRRQRDRQRPASAPEADPQLAQIGSQEKTSCERSSA
jgi:hypothetical protein